MMTEHESSVPISSGVSNKPPICGKNGPPPVAVDPSPNDDLVATNGLLFNEQLIGYLLINLSILSVLLTLGILIVSQNRNSQVVRLAHFSENVSAQDCVVNNANAAPSVGQNRGVFTEYSIEPTVEQDSLPKDFSHKLEQSNSTLSPLVVATFKTAPLIATGVYDTVQRFRESRSKSRSVVDRQITPFEDRQKQLERENLDQVLQSQAIDGDQPEQTSENTCSDEQCGVVPDASTSELTEPKQFVKAPYYGTKIKWNRLAKDAASIARSQDKLVFLIHVSGNFTKEEFT